jgi:hypothetical protein
MVSSSWRIMASPQVVRHEDIALPSILQAGKRPDIMAAEFSILREFCEEAG